MKVSRVVVRVRPRPYPVYVGSRLLGSLPRLLARHVSGRRCVLVTDRYLERGLAAQVAWSLRRSGWEVALKALPRGEKAKSFAALTDLYGFLLRRRVERRTPLIAVGGGTVGDAAGFAAATFYRGVPLVHVPTTLLAQVDSAIGGKTAVNHPLAKNAVGAFYQPALVAADVDVLKTLPEREVRAGLAEVVKYALVFDRPFAGRLRRGWGSLIRGVREDLVRTVRRCVELKASVVAADERDLSGRRELLNFGHTVGHALESATGYRRFLHGEGVSWGMRAALRLSEGRGWMRRPADRALAWALLESLPAPAWPKGLTLRRLLAPLAHDKKVRGAKNVFVLLKDIGTPVRVGDVTPDEIRAALSSMGVRS
ncbi:MAG: 3-dehydroquinate synthase [Elusimicrobiota bacterium]